MKAHRLYRFAAVAAFVGASSSVVSAPPPSHAATVCGYVRVNGMDTWPVPCDPPCPGTLIADSGISRDTTWVFLCLV
jgi:hypothetical protein